MKTLLFICSFLCFRLAAQTCLPGGCTLADTNSTGRYPSGVFTTTTSTWATVSQYMNAGNYTIFNVTNGKVYEWSYCSDFGGNQNWNAALTLFNASTGAQLCFQDNSNRPGCPTAPYLRWTATFTGKVKLLTTVSSCSVNTGSPYSKLVWRDTTGAPLVQVLGVDVYSGQGNINWVQAKNAGYTFAWAKATEGVGYTDSKYLMNAVNGPAAGIKMGAYHFARPDLNPTNAGAINEANYFLSVAQPYITTCELPPSLDLEGSYLQSNFTSAQLTAWVQNWMTTVQNATGIKPVIYISASTAAYLNSSVNTYPLWTDYVDGSSTNPPPSTGVWPTWTFKQYDWTATVPGIPGSTTDLNVFNGNMAAFNNLIGCITTGMRDNYFSDVFIVYPNPSSESFRLNYPASFGEAVLKLYDINGKLVLEKTVQQSETVETAMLPTGVYNLNILCDHHVVNKRVVIVKQQ